jgi:putative transcriptional regulator
MTVRHRKTEDGFIRLTAAEAQEGAKLTPEQEARLDAMTDADIARQIAEDPDVAPDLTDPDVAKHFRPVPDPDVRIIRECLDLDRHAFAAAFGFAVDALEAWEQGRSRPSGANLILLRMLEADPEGMRRIREKAKPPAPIGQE